MNTEQKPYLGLNMNPGNNETIYIVVIYEDKYVQPLIENAIHQRLPHNSYEIAESVSHVRDESNPVLQICEYEELDFDLTMRKRNSLVNSYVIRKALIRKHFLSNTISTWVTKHPDSSLGLHCKQSVDFELDYAEFLDDALIEAYELNESLASNEDKRPEDRQWWILKPGMSDRGQGIRLFSLESDLIKIFEEWDPDSESEDEIADDTADASDLPSNTGILTSHLRHFVAQEYIHPPLLMSLPNDRTSHPYKFHIRTYVLAVGALKVYVFKRMLALFSAVPYSEPWKLASTEDLKAHLTNTCLQDSDLRDGSVCEFWSLPKNVLQSAKKEPTETTLVEDWRALVYEKVCAVTGEIFEAAARGMMVHFQPLPNAFEIYGVDFMVDENLSVYLLEVNAFPDFKQTGDDLKDVIQDLWNEVIDTAVKPFFGYINSSNTSEKMTKVCDIDLGRR